MYFFKFFILKIFNFLFLMESFFFIWIGNIIVFVKWYDKILIMNYFLYIIYWVIGWVNRRKNLGN